jgi:hypothetical protein
MQNVDQKFLDDLQREDDIGFILRGHIHVESQLIELLKEFFPFPEHCDFEKLNYRSKVEIACAAGLTHEIKNFLYCIGSIRNKFAHRVDSSVSANIALDLYHSLPESYRSEIRHSYMAFGKVEHVDPSSIEPRELMTLLFIHARQAVKAAVTICRRSKA